jgi:hypothetical protein
MASPLRDFNRRSVDELLEEGVHMVYDHSMIREERWGFWQADYFLIGINPNLMATVGRKEENVTIIHEWLHAYEDLILDVSRRFKESQIDWWAYRHLERDSGLAEYIRNSFQDYGFKHDVHYNKFLKRHSLGLTCLTPLKKYSSNPNLEKNL